MPLSFNSKITSATKLMCSFWACMAASADIPLINTDKRSPERVETPEKTWPGMVDVGTPMQKRSSTKLAGVMEVQAIFWS